MSDGLCKRSGSHRMENTLMAMAKSDPEREERRRQQKETADELKASGALDEIFALIARGGR